jgi:hypothetical protein
MRTLPQEDHADLGLVDDDNTEEMRTPPAGTRGDLNEPTHSLHERKAQW